VAGAYFDEKTAESEALLKILDAELLARNLRALLQQVLEITTRTFGASVGGLVLKDVDSDLLGLQASVGLEVEDYGVSLKIGQGFSGAIAANGEPDIVLDTDRDDRMVSETLRRKCKTLWGVPLITPGGTQGVMIIGFEKPYFEWLPKERALMRALGERSALAIERARMMDALREREALIADLSGHLLRGQEDERRRISRELHDETGQALMVIRLYLGMLEPMVRSGAAREKIRETVEVVDRTVEGLRRMIGKLSPLVLEELGLVAALRKEAKDLAKTAGIAAKVSIDENVGRLGPEKETAIYRIVQEALHNVAKHAKAQNVTVALSRENTDVRVVIQDDGVGMGMALSQKSQVGGQSFGLAGIKERVKTFGGTVRIVSVKGEGTRIEVVIPATEQRLPEPVGQPYLVHSSDRTPMQETGTGKPLMLSAKV
jgi:signal transduction histidine kinase